MKLLVVEDDADSRELTCRLITHEFPNLTVLKATDGKRGMALYREHLPDIVITDLTMPEMDGIELASKIKALRDRAKIIIVTAHSDKSRLRSMSLGVNDYILKPIDFTLLILSIRTCLDEIAHEVTRGLG